MFWANGEWKTSSKRKIFWQKYRRTLVPIDRYTIELIMAVLLILCIKMMKIWFVMISCNEGDIGCCHEIVFLTIETLN